MNVVMTGRGGFVEIQGTAEGAVFSKKEMDELIRVAQRGIREITRIQKKALDGKGVKRETMELLVATRNRGKVREIRKALRGLGFRIHSLNDFQDVPEMEEDGRSFAENAFKKARFYSEVFRTLTISDDSGLEVDFLKGAPGIYSARFAGEKATDRENNQKLLQPDGKRSCLRREARRFRCAIAIVSPGEEEAGGGRGMQGEDRF